MHPALVTFIDHMDRLVASSEDPRAIAEQTSSHLQELLATPEFLAAEFREPAADRYRQHVVHVHPEGKYSIVSLVWQPGQETPVHDHRCWCVVGVLEGREREERFLLHADGEREWLSRAGEEHYEPGQVCYLVPPEEDIHRVANAADELTISMHIYGADIAVHGTSINRTFDLPIEGPSANGEGSVSWRDRDPAPLTARGGQ